METSDITPVKPIAAILYQKKEVFEEAIPLLEDTFSSVSYTGSFFPFVETNYYEPEMGAGLQRGIIAFNDLVHPGDLVSLKLAAKKLETRLSDQGNRCINIDIGFLDIFKVVLASFKGRSNKIYLAKGVWADMILYFEEGQYKSFMWGFPDFKSSIYNEDLIKIRNHYKAQLKAVRKTDASLI